LWKIPPAALGLKNSASKCPSKFMPKKPVATAPAPRMRTEHGEAVDASCCGTGSGCGDFH
jgi:hypothetical protein